jgi:archaemetzincin
MLRILAIVAAILTAVVPLGAADPRVDALRATAQRLLPLHRAKTAPPQPWEWLAQHQEDGQTFAAYVAGRPDRVNAERTTVYLQPIGTFDAPRQRLIADTADLLRRFYGAPVTIAGALDPQVIPAAARRTNPGGGQEQFLTGFVLDQVLKPRRPRDAIAVLGLTTTDLWPGEGWNFVFGMASFTERTGVWSLWRYGDPASDYATCLHRTLKVALHETGHMVGIAHCIAYECLMNGSNSLRETDAQPLHACPECEAKIWWACRVDPAQRYASLVEFAKAHGLAAEAAFWERSRIALAP